MPITVSLREIIEEMGLQSDEVFSYLNTQTGELVTVTSDEMNAVEEDDGGDFDEAMLATARAVLAGKPYIPLPDRFEINEYSIMRNFAESLTDERASALLQAALHGSGAFRRFKDTADILGVIEGWYRYRDEAYEEIAIEWCEHHKIEYRRE